MRRRLAVAVLCAGLAVSVQALAALAQGSDAARVLIFQAEGPIDGILDDAIRTRLAEAERSGATFVLQLDAPGTLDRDALGLAEALRDATVPTAVWVGPTPARAAGGALLLVHAASIAGVAPGAAVGPLVPLDVADPDAAVGDLAGRISGWATSSARTSPAVLDAAIPAQSAIDAGIVEVAAPSVTDFLAKIDGRTVVTAVGERILATRVATAEGDAPVQVSFTSLGPVDRVLHASSTPTSVFLLLIFAAAALAFELTQPGFGFAGFSGIALLALGVYGVTVVQPSPLGFALLVGGILLLVWDVQFRRLRWPTIAGTAAFLAGSVLAYGDVAPAIGISPWLIGGATITTVLYYGFVLTVALQSRDRITSTQQGLLGLVGEARTDLRPEGSVHVKGTLWRGKAEAGTILAGTKVRVRGLDGLVLRVEALPAGATIDAEADAEADTDAPTSEREGEPEA